MNMTTFSNVNKLILQNTYSSITVASRGLSLRHTATEQRSSLMCNANGNQHMQYMPFGELLVDQRSSSGHDIRFKFTGKERDAATGFDYFGARYYDSDISVWLSVDPLTARYPSTSPYAYVENNPIRFVDPNGLFKREFSAKLYKFFYGGEVKQNSQTKQWYVEKKLKSKNVKAPKNSKDGMGVRGGTVGLKMSYSWGKKGKSDKSNHLSDYSRITPNNLYGVKHTHREEINTQITNPLGVLTVNRYSQTSFGDGVLNITQIGSKTGNNTEPSINQSVAGVSITLAPSSLSLAVGLKNTINIGVNTNGVMFGYSIKSGKLTSGTQYSWKPGPLFKMALAPVVSPAIAPVPVF